MKRECVTCGMISDNKKDFFELQLSYEFQKSTINTF